MKTKLFILIGAAFTAQAMQGPVFFRGVCSSIVERAIAVSLHNRRTQQLAVAQEEQGLRRALEFSLQEVQRKEKKTKLMDAQDLNDELLWLIQQKGSVGDVRRIIEQGARVNGYYGEGPTPLMWALKLKRYEIVQYLIEVGADVNAEDCEGRTPLDYAALTNSVALCRELVENGANLNPVSEYTRTTFLERALLNQIDHSVYVYLSKSGAKL